MKKTRLIAFCLILSVLLATALISSNAEEGFYCKVQRMEYAYLEPAIDEMYVAGQFALTGNVLVTDSLTDAYDQEWYCVEYEYDPQIEMQFSIDKTEDECGPEGRRTIYILASETIPLPDGEHTADKNALLENASISYESEAGYNEFDSGLLMDMNYMPQALKESKVVPDVTERTKTIGDEIDFKDILTMQSQPTVHGMRWIFTPRVTIADQLAYPLGKAEPLLTEQETYQLTGKAITDEKVMEGIYFILRNAPPYRVYCSFPADYENASRTAAALALRAFMKDYAGTDDDIDIYNDLQAYSPDDFNADYMGYMYWLYQNAVQEYMKADAADTLYISVDSDEPVATEDGYTITLHVITNAEYGWRLEKGSLPEDVTIAGADEDDTSYYGTGSTYITLKAGYMSANKTIPLCFGYNDTEPVLYIFESAEEILPLIALMTEETELQPAKIHNVRFDSNSSIEFRVVDSKNEPIKNVAIQLSRGENTVTDKTHENGQYTFSGIAGTYTYHITAPDGYMQPEDGAILLTDNAKENTTIKLKHFPCTICVFSKDSLTDEMLAGCEIRLVCTDDETELKGVTDETGIVVFDELDYGHYRVEQTNAVRGYDIPAMAADVVINESGKEYTAEILNESSGGSIRVTIIDKETNAPVRNAEVIVRNENKTEVARGMTEKNGDVCFSNLPAGKYKATNGAMPTGYDNGKKNAFEESLRVKSRQETELTLKYTAVTTDIVICPREKSEYDSLDPEKIKAPKNRTGECKISGLTYVIKAGAEIADTDGNIVYRTGDTVCEAVVDDEDYTANAKIRYTGEYIISQKGNRNNYKADEDIAISVDISEKKMVVPILKIPETRRVVICRTDSEGNPQKDTSYYLYNASAKTYSSAPNMTKWELITDDNGYAFVEEVPYGEYQLVPIKNMANDNIDDKYYISINDSTSSVVTFYISGKNVGRFVKVKDLDADNNARIDKPTAYKVFSMRDNVYINTDPTSGGSPEFTLTGEGMIPFTLTDGEYLLQQTQAPEGYQKASAVSLTIGGENEQEIQIYNQKGAYRLCVNVYAPTGIKSAGINNRGKIETLELEYNYAILHDVSVGLRDGSGNTVTELMSNVISSTAYNGEFGIELFGIPDNLYVKETAQLKLKTNESETEEVHVTDIYLAYRPTNITVNNIDLSEMTQNALCYGVYLSDELSVVFPAGTFQKPVKTITVASDHVVIPCELPSGVYRVARVADADTGEPAPEQMRFMIHTPGDSVEVDMNNIHGVPVTVRVISEDTGEALPNTYVRLSSEEEVFTDYTNEAGEIKWYLERGTYTCDVLLVPETYAVPSESISFEVNADSQVIGDTEFQVKQLAVSIRETDTYGKPISGITMEMMKEDTVLSAVTDDDGIATFTGISYGGYIIQERYPAPGYTANKSKVSIGIDGSTKNSGLPVTTLISKINTVYCLVEDTSGIPIPNTAVCIATSTGSIVQEIRTDAQGKVILYGIPYGTYTITVNGITKEYLNPANAYTVVINNDYQTNAETPFVFNAPEKKLCYCITDANGNGIADAELALIKKDTNETVQKVRTGKDGYAVFTNIDYGGYIVSETGVPEGNARIADFDADIDADGAYEGVHPLRSVPNSYTFVSKDNRGHKLPAVKFIARRTKESGIIVTANENGIVKLENLEQGTYTIKTYTVPDGYVPSDETFSIQIDENYQPPEQMYIYVTKIK